MSPRVGDDLPRWGLESVDPAMMARFAGLLADPNPIHLDADVVRRLGLGDRVVNQGPVNLGYLQNMLTAFAGHPGRIRSIRVRFAASVFAGDRVVAGGRVTAIREHPGTAPDRLAECDVWLDAFRPGESAAVRVLGGTATVVLGVDGAGVPTPR